MKAERIYSILQATPKVDAVDFLVALAAFGTLEAGTIGLFNAIDPAKQHETLKLLAATTEVLTIPGVMHVSGSLRKKRS